MTKAAALALKTWRRRVFVATWISYASFYFCRKPFYITKPVLASELGFSTETLGLIGSAFLIAYALGQFMTAWLGSRFGARVVVLLGMVVSLCANFSFGLSSSVGAFLALMTVNGFAQATGWAGNVASMAPWFKRTERGTVMGVWATNFQAGGVLANGASSWILAGVEASKKGGEHFLLANTAIAAALGAYGYGWAYFFGSLVLFVASIVFLFGQRNRPEDVGLPPIDADTDATSNGPSEQGEQWSRATWINVLYLGTFYFFIKFIRYAIWSWTPFLLKKYYGLEASDAGYLSTIFDVFGIAGVIAAGFISDRWFLGRRVRISFYFVAAMFASSILLYTLGQTSLVVFGLAIGLLGFFLYGPDALLTSAGAIEVGSVRSAAKAAGIISGMGAIGSVAQELVLGKMLSKDDVGLVFLTLVLSSVLSAACLGILMLRNRLGHSDL
ncbi:MAG: MFS transporter [Deltaproteobacteria bacterium]|nr:MFS transporter [Deltaproteobacteria bacterium]